LYFNHTRREAKDANSFTTRLKDDRKKRHLSFSPRGRSRGVLMEMNPDFSARIT